MTEVLTVDVVYARLGEQDVVRLALAPGSTLEQALRASGLIERHPEIDLAQNPVGVFGRAADLATALREHDRVEIYRPLRIDPKESRRRRAARKK